VNGTITFPGETYLFTSGTWTITATDIAPGSTLTGTSSPVTIP
jgi:hypothetical protein